MPLADFVEYLVCWRGATMRHIVKALPDSLMHVGADHYIEKPLVWFRILHDRFRLAFDGEHDRALVLLELLHELAGIAPEGGDGMDVFRDVEPGDAAKSWCCQDSGCVERRIVTGRARRISCRGPLPG